MSSVTDVKGTYVLDPSHTQIGFVARHAMVTKVRGAFEDFTGTATVDGASPESSTLEVTVQTASINTRNEGRDAHLKSADFFEVEKYPTITFVGKGFDVAGGVVNVTGDLTIKGVTKPVTIPFEFAGAAKDPFGNERIGFEGSVTVDRRDWDLTWNVALEAGGLLVSEKVVLEFEVSAIKQA